MPKLKNIFRYIGQYGIKSTVGLIREKLFIDQKRFSQSKKRSLPIFKKSYNKAEISFENKPKKPYNVMFLLHYFYPKKKGGTERFTLNLAKEITKRGEHAVVLVLEANEPRGIYTERFGDILYRYYEYDGIRCIGFRYRRAPLGLYYKRIVTDDPIMSDFARHITEKERITVVHATYPQPFVPFLTECRRNSLPYVITCTDFCMNCHYATMVDKNGDFCISADGGNRCDKVCKTYGCKDFKERMSSARIALMGAALVTVPSSFVAGILSSEFPDVRFLPVNHGIDESFMKKNTRDKVRRFVYAGTISPLKGIHLLIDAFSRLHGDELSLKIYGSGDDKYEARLRRMADSRVEFLGAVTKEKMPEIYSEADCVIIPSMWYETYNFVLREAASTGALVIAADIGAMSEAVSVGENGFLFSPSDKDDLYRKMRLALDFDFKNYKPMKVPKTTDEGEFYHTVYGAISK